MALEMPVLKFNVYFVQISGLRLCVIFKVRKLINFVLKRKLSTKISRRIAKKLQWGEGRLFEGSELPALENFVVFDFRSILIKLMLLKRGIEISCAKA